MQESNELPTYSPEEVEQLITLVEELQTENENFRVIHNQKEKQIQTLSSEKRKLSEMVQSQALQIQQQAELIEKLNASDLQLKKLNEREKELNEQEKQRKRREKQVTNTAYEAEQRAIAAENRAEQREREAKTAKEEADKLKRNQKLLIKNETEKEVEIFRNKYAGIAVIVIMYSFIATVLTGLKSERVIADCKKSASLIVTFFKNLVTFMLNVMSTISGISDNISQPIVSNIVYALLILIFAIIFVGIIITIFYFSGKWLVSVYSEYCWNEITLLEILSSLAILVWEAELMPLNIVLLLILSHIVYIIVCWYIKGYRESKGLY